MSSKNFALGTVATAPSPATSGTSLVLGAGEGALFPDPSTDGNFQLTIFPTDAAPTLVNAEIVTVTARSTDTLTIVRAQESTSARTVVVGDRVHAGITAAMWDALAVGGSDKTVPTVAQWKFDTPTANADPGAGYFRLSNAAKASATSIYLSTTDNDAVDRQLLVDILSEGAKVFLRSVAEPTKWARYGITLVTDNAGWFRLTTRYEQGNGGEFIDEDVVELTFNVLIEQGVLRNTYQIAWSVAGDVAIGTYPFRAYVPYPSRVVRLEASVGTAPVGSAITVWPRQDAGVYSYNCSIAAGANYGFTDYGTSGSIVAQGAYYEVTLFGVGSTTPGADMVVQMTFDRLD